MVEFWLKLTVGKLLTTDGNIAAIVVSETPFKGLVAMAKSLVYYKTEDPNLRKRCDELSKRMIDAEELRNGYLHSQWMPVAGQKLEFTGKYIRAKSTAKVRHGLHQKWQVYTRAELAADVGTLVKLSQDWGDFDLQLMKAGVSSLHKIGLKLSPDVMKVVERLRNEAGRRSA
jgi:hypothetical protein